VGRLAGARARTRSHRPQRLIVVAILTGAIVIAAAILYGLLAA
jgi:hypothetical protein